MVIIRTHFLIFVLLFSFVRLTANEPANFTIQENSTFTFQYRPSDVKSLNNYFIREIANYNYLDIYKAAYVVSYEHTVSIGELADGTFRLSSKIYFDTIGGDVFYEGFNISDVLEPSAYNFDLSVFDKDFRLVSVFNFKDLQISDPKNEPEFSLDLAEKKGLIFKISGFSFTYINTDKERFTQRIRQVNEYSGFLDLSRHMVKKADSINPDIKDFILPNYFMIYDLERFCKITSSLKPDPNLNIPTNDSLVYVKNLSYLNTNLRRLKTIYTQNVDTLHKEIGNEEVLSAANKIIELQLEYLKILDRSSYMYQPVYNRLAVFFPDEEAWPALLAELSSYFSKQPEIRLDQDFNDRFGRTLYRNYLAKSDSLINLEKYNEAFLMLESAAVICHYLNEKGCDVDVFNRMSRAKYGIYDAYLKIAGQALNKKNLTLAKNYLEMARDFQEENHSMIISAELTDQHFEKLANAYWERGLQDMKVGWSIEALNDLTAAREIFLRLNEKSNLQTLRTNMGKAFVLKFDELVRKVENALADNDSKDVDEAISQISMLVKTYPDIDFDRGRLADMQLRVRKNNMLIQLNRFQLALQNQMFDDAALILKTIVNSNPGDQGNPDAEINDILQRFLKPAFLEKIYLAETRKQENKIIESENLASQILELKSKFPGFHDPVVDSTFSRLMRSLESGECAELRKHFNLQTAEILKLIDDKAYTVASQLINQLMQEIKKSKNCNVSDSTLTSIRDKYNDLFVYYQLLTQVGEKFKKNDFYASIEIHLKAETYYYQNNIYRFGEPFQPIDEFISDKANPGLNSAAIGYYSRKNDYTKMLRLLHLYVNKSFDIGKYDSYLKEAGAYMALQDKARYPQSDPVFMLEKLTLRDQAFQPFRLAYLKAWKGK